MRLRSQILGLLFFLGFTPLVTVTVINLPLIYAQVEFLFQKEHLQNLRADFRDLDQQISGRHEMVRLLAKLPEPGALLGNETDTSGHQIEQARLQYTQWINWILGDLLDITQILFLNAEGRILYWLERDKDTLAFAAGNGVADLPSTALFDKARMLPAGAVLISPISFNPEVRISDPQRFMMLRLISPLHQKDHIKGQASASVAINIDVGGLASAYPNTYWVRHDGQYVHYGEAREDEATAFADFPGLKKIFAQETLALWRGDGKQSVIWAPMFVTESSGPLWVGRHVDPSPIDAFWNTLVFRSLGIAIVLIIIILLVARRIALRVEKFGHELKQGIGQVINEDRAVNFEWGGSEDLRSLGEDLSNLAREHQHNRASLLEHARALEESNEYKSQFLANVSHELRTPLNSILLLSKLLGNNDQNRLSQEEREQLDIIHNAGKDLLSLIDTVLDLSKVEANMETVELSTIDLNKLLGELIALIKPIADEKGLEITLNIDHAVTTAIVNDREKISQIIKNFLSNSIKFTEEGTIGVHIGENREDDSTRRPLSISVSDSGIGIPKNKHSLIFDAFKQADGSTSRRFGGTGLGLTISRELSALIGGRIKLESSEGRGSTFSLVIPVTLDTDGIDHERLSFVNAVADEVTTPEAPNINDAVHSASFSAQKLLIVDDDIRHLIALTPILRGWGLTILAAADGAEALDTLTSEPDIELVLMDIMLPGMSGIETIRAIRAHQQLKDIPVIALTSCVSDDDKVQCTDAGATDFVTKPVDPNVLHAAITHIFNSHTTEPTT